jgi:deoxyribose-phosphate aldolase
VKVAAVIGFPLGAATTKSKVFETKELVEMGVDEIDMVINIGFLKSKDYVAVLDDIHQVVQVAKTTKASSIIKVTRIFSYLQRSFLKPAC